jgi:hypothetical protein
MGKGLELVPPSIGLLSERQKQSLDDEFENFDALLQGRRIAVDAARLGDVIEKVVEQFAHDCPQLTEEP